MISLIALIEMHRSTYVFKHLNGVQGCLNVECAQLILVCVFLLEDGICGRLGSRVWSTVESSRIIASAIACGAFILSQN